MDVDSDWTSWLEGAKARHIYTNQNFRGAHYANLWATSEVTKQNANDMVFYYYYDQLCKVINSSPCITCEVTDTDGKPMRFAADRHHIYLQPCAQQGGNRHIGYYRMMQEDIEQVNKDQPKIWVEKLEKEKEKGKGKEKETTPEKGKGKEKEKEKEDDKGKDKERVPKKVQTR